MRNFHHPSWNFTSITIDQPKLLSESEYTITLAAIPTLIDFYEEVLESRERAKSYPINQRWCTTIINGWLFINIGRVLCIYIFEIENNQSPEDKFIWVMEGDFPSIYLDSVSTRTTNEVVQLYIELAMDWIDAARANQPFHDCFPFDVEVNKDMIDLFAGKVAELKDKIVDQLEALPIASIEK